jgi:hypothetical protein
LNEACNVNGVPGVCVKTSSCKSSGGISTPGHCPNDPADVQCCTKGSCGSSGSCKWFSQCQHTSLPKLNACPGPAGFMCCLPTGNTPSNPPIPTYKCLDKTRASGKKILDTFPGKIHTVYCWGPYDPKFPNGDHPKGKALDLMIWVRSWSSSN